VGIYDRDYYRQEQRSSPFSHAPRTVVGWLIAVNVVIWLVDGLLMPGLCQRMAVHFSTLTHPFRASTLTHPLYWWQFLTAGFAHSPEFGHIFGNMLVLFFLGRDVEDIYGPKEFLRLYLATLVFANVAWSVVNKIVGMPAGVGDYDVLVYGASGAIAGIVVLYALNFPHRTLLLFFVIPMPAWLLDALVVAYDVYGAMGGVAGSNVAYSVHVAGAAFALIYYKQHWNFTRLTDGRFQWLRLPAWFGGKPRLRVHRPKDEPEESALDADLTREVDRILEKIGREGEANLTAKERRTLETASRQYRRKMAKHE
jgi:membrane associated rhomboid family serine protease